MIYSVTQVGLAALTQAQVPPQRGRIVYIAADQQGNLITDQGNLGFGPGVATPDLKTTVTISGVFNAAAAAVLNITVWLEEA